MTGSRFYFVADGFFEGAPELRRQIKIRFSERQDPFAEARFAWEPWFVPGQFSQLRAPFRAVFSTELAAAFEARLLRWAGRLLGAATFGGPPWVSILRDGDFQSLHRDSPNGELAFSFGLSWPKEPRFRGGETLLARPELLAYFAHGGHRPERAHEPLFDAVPSRFNRLVCFDSRIPHAVRTVEGPRHPLEGRITVQGWMRVGGPTVDAAPADEALTEALASALARCPRSLGEDREGLFTVHVRLEPGRGTGVRPPRRARADVTVELDLTVATAGGVDDGGEALGLAVAEAVRSALEEGRAKLPRSARSLVVPVMLDAGGRLRLACAASA